ncbi:MAG: hypothetical protein JJU10_11250 [Idiomarina sp.]|nr:hypothetical protein [Idiomarina sp.]
MAKAGLWIVLLMFSTILISQIGLVDMKAFATESSSEPELTLSGPSGTISEGYFRLQFTGADRTRDVVIEQGGDDSFETIRAEFSPMGDFDQIALSGFPDGTFYFRAREGDNFSETVTVTVQHYPLWQALGLFAAGAILFFLLAWTLIRAHRNRNKEASHG